MIALFATLWATVSAVSQDLDRPPINYANGDADNPVARLNERLASRAFRLQKHEEFGYLPAVLEALGIPKSSQTLVFSKTSLQQRVIAPRTPRALYFNDDVYVGYCQNGEVLEVSTADLKLGTAFYTLYQEAERPKFARQNDNCLQCHGSTATRGFPGHLVRSLHVAADGHPFYSSGSFRTDPTSPFVERWGGWYATGTHGAAKHLGNTVFGNRDDADLGGPRPAGQNVTDLRARFDTTKYLTPHSDLVALMVLEHQADMHNRLCRAALDVRLALSDQAALNRELGEPNGKQWDSTKARLRNAAETVVEGLLFAGEAKLEAPVKGTSGFAQEFARRGPHDKKGRSLREFDMRTRMFRYPCSYLIHSAAFAGLPEEVRAPALTRLHALLSSSTPAKAVERLTVADRQALLEIVRDTVPNLPSVWHPAAPK
jgi:hypothetical protein